MKTLIFMVFALLTGLALAVAAPAHSNWSAVIVAGSSQQVVFDNAAIAVQEKLTKGDVGSRRFTSDLEKAGVRDGVHIPFATLDGLELSLTRGSGPCFLYITTHGAPGGGIEYGRQELTPGILSEILYKTCGDKPTVLVVSACYSGAYLRLQRPNMVIFTASDAAHSSFGCSNDETYTYWDGCFLEAANQPLRRWSGMYIYIQDCVSRKEKALGVEEPSNPQFYQGSKSPQERPW